MIETAECRLKLEAEGKPFPKSSCLKCGLTLNFSDCPKGRGKTLPEMPSRTLADAEEEIRTILKSVLYHFGPEGAYKVTSDVLAARARAEEFGQ